MLKIWDWRKKKLLKSNLGHGHPIRCICLLKFGQILATGSATINTGDVCSIKIWDLINNSIIITLTGHKKTINQIVKLYEDVFASCSFDTTVKVWNWKKN